ncbi:unnamed protein product, partial [Ilex paraguariensis]
MVFYLERVTPRGQTIIPLVFCKTPQIGDWGDSDVDLNDPQVVEGHQAEEMVDVVFPRITHFDDDVERAIYLYIFDLNLSSDEILVSVGDHEQGTRGVLQALAPLQWLSGITGRWYLPTVFS